MDILCGQFKSIHKLESMLILLITFVLLCFTMNKDIDSSYNFETKEIKGKSKKKNLQMIIKYS